MKHEIVEKNLGLMIVLIVLTISGGFLAEVVPLFFLKETNEPVEGLEPLSALELEGRDIYIREGCHVFSPSRSARFGRRPSGMVTTPLRASSCTTVRSCGVPSAPARIWPA